MELGDRPSGHLPTFLKNMKSLVLAVIDDRARLIEANHGFLRLIDAERESAGLDVAPFFMNPSFASLRASARRTSAQPVGIQAVGEADSEPGSESPELVYWGLITLGHVDGTAASVRGEVHLTGGRFLLVAEHDIEDLETLTTEMIAITERMAQTQRELVQAKEELERRESKLQTLASTDPLTELANRRQLTKRLGEEIERSERMGTPLSLVMLELDHFKEFNDEWGHLCGDACLRGLATVLEGHSRLYDTAARFGGEEFVLVLPGADLASAAARAERIREAIAAAEISGTDAKVTASLGVATYTGGTGEDLLGEADRALYAAKDAGHDCVRIATNAPASG